MTDEIVILPKRLPGQDIGNSNPPAVIMEVVHDGHKADPDSWTRTKNIRYKKKQAKQRIDAGKGDKWMETLLVAKHHD